MGSIVQMDLSESAYVVLMLLFIGTFLVVLFGRAMARFILAVVQALLQLSISTLEETISLPGIQKKKVQDEEEHWPGPIKRRVPRGQRDPRVRAHAAWAVSNRRNENRNRFIFRILGTVLLLCVVGFIVLGVVALSTSPLAL